MKRRSLAIFLAAFLLSSFTVAYLASPYTMTVKDVAHVEFEDGSSLYVASGVSLYLPAHFNLVSHTMRFGSSNFTVTPTSGTFDLTLSSYLPSEGVLSLTGGNGTSLTVSASWNSPSTVSPISVTGDLDSFTTSALNTVTGRYAYSTDVSGGGCNATFFVPSSIGDPLNVTIGGTEYDTPGSSPTGYSITPVGGGENVTVMDAAGSDSDVIAFTPVPPSTGGGGPPATSTTTTTTTQTTSPPPSTIDLFGFQMDTLTLALCLVAVAIFVFFVAWLGRR